MGTTAGDDGAPATGSTGTPTTASGIADDDGGTTKGTAAADDDAPPSDATIDPMETTASVDDGTTVIDPSQGSSEGTTIIPEPGDEICDGIDNDGDGGTDEGSPTNPECNDCVFILANDGDSYFAVCETFLIWEAARAACDVFGPDSDLAIIDNDTDQTTLLIATTPTGDHALGMHDIDEEGHWVWVDGTDAIVGDTVIGYNGWNPAQPKGGLAENCGELDPAQLGWADTDCL